MLSFIELHDSVPPEPESDKDEETDHGRVTGVEKNFASAQANDRGHCDNTKEC